MYTTKYIFFFILTIESISFPVTPKIDASQKLNNSADEKDTKENDEEKGDKIVAKESTTPSAKKVAVSFFCLEDS